MSSKFTDLESAEKILSMCEPTGDAESDYTHLEVLLTYERLVDKERVFILQQNQADSPEAKDYIFREYMLRHNISAFAMKLDKTVTDRIIGEKPGEQSFLATSIKNREEYPKPVKNN